MKRIAIFDYRVVPTNPIGGCHRRMLASLAADHEFTVFAVEFDNPAPDRIAFQRVPVPRRPLALLFVTYHLVAPVCYWIHRIRHRKRFDWIQSVESNLCFARITYTQFCHRAYLRLNAVPLGKSNLRQLFRWLDHRLHAAFEPWVYRRARHIIVPSRGTRTELEREYPATRGKVRVIYNPVDVDRMRRPADFDAAAWKRRFGWRDDDIVLVFVALGHFERKGLPILLAGLQQLDDPRIKLLVVGGEKGLVTEYAGRVRHMNLDDRVAFTGSRSDVRPYLWAADAFAFPSHYEAFPLVALEAAAAGLPLIVPAIHGVEELVRDGENGLVIERTPASAADALRRFAGLDQATARAMGARAAEDVRRYASDLFAPRWRAFYAELDEGAAMEGRRNGSLA